MENLFVLTIKNEGQSVNIGFPCKDSILEEKLKGIGAQGKKEHFVDELYDGDRAMQILRKREVDLDEVNYLAKRLDSFANEELRAFYAVASVDRHLSVASLINQTFNMERVTLIENVSNLEAVGKRHYMSMNGCVIGGPDNQSKEDYIKIGKELLESGKGIATQYGLLFRNEEIEEEIVYNGKTFPPYYTGDTVIGLALKYNEDEEFVYLPCEDISIEKALKRLGAPSIDDCERSIDLLDISNNEAARFFEDLALNYDLYDVNKLVGKFHDEDGEKLMSVIKYANNASIDTVETVLNNLEKFEYMANVEELYEVGRRAMDKAIGVTIPEELESYIDHDGYGRYIKDAYHGKFVEDGFVYLPNGETLEEILGQEQGPKMGGM